MVVSLTFRKEKQNNPPPAKQTPQGRHVNLSLMSAITFQWAPSFPGIFSNMARFRTDVALNAILLRSGFDLPADWILVTDSLWSYPKHILEFLELHWRFVISAKDNTTAIPSQLASESLRFEFSRTFTDKFLTLQLYHGEQGVTAVVSNMASRANAAPTGELPKLSYKSALEIFENDSPASVIRAFGLSEALLSLSIAQIVHQATGWVNELCPRDISVHRMRHHPESIKWSLQPWMRVLMHFKLLRHQLYDIFHNYYSCIDQMDKAFYAHAFSM